MAIITEGNYLFNLKVRYEYDGGMPRVISNENYIDIDAADTTEMLLRKVQGGNYQFTIDSLKRLFGY